MRRYSTFILFLLALWIASSCAPEGYYSTQTSNAPDPTPTREIAPTDAPARLCRGIPEPPLQVMSDDYCLFSAPVTLMHSQTIPRAWAINNLLENVDGFADDYTGYAAIMPFAPTGEFPPERGYQWSIEGRNGSWGLSQEVAVPAGCVVVKARWSARILELVSINRGRTIGLRAELGDYVLDTIYFPIAPDTNEWIWPIMTNGGDMLLTVFVQANYATAISGTEIVLHSAGLFYDPTGGHCQ